MRGPGVGSGLSGERGLSGKEAGADTEVAELLPFLVPGARADLQAAAAQHVLALTGVGSGRTLLAGQTALLRALIDLAVAPIPAPSRDASRALVNLAADPDLHWQMLAADPELPVRLLRCVLDPQWPWAEELAAVLANLSREPAPCAVLTEKLVAAEPERLGLERLVSALCMPSYNASAPLHYLGPLLSNPAGGGACFSPGPGQVCGPTAIATYPVHRLLGAQGRGGGNTSELLFRTSTPQVVTRAPSRHSPLLATALGWA
ncbi:brain protein 16 [Rattus norvegicus]|uniref:Brain protein 16 n=1 Tax=Rattus norvegicus TaxID=10116 RepID=A6HS95_RAT|nr:brain protein 16 [Rattus norvegicus]